MIVQNWFHFYFLSTGFGVCCQIVLNGCGGTVTRNCTYIQNPEYPSSTTAASSCKFVFTRESTDICFIRLDFDITVADPISLPNAPADVGGARNGHCDVDTITIM